MIAPISVRKCGGNTSTNSATTVNSPSSAPEDDGIELGIDRLIFTWRQESPAATRSLWYRFRV